jgi:hypothetical protein
LALSVSSLRAPFHLRSFSWLNAVYLALGLLSSIGLDRPAQCQAGVPADPRKDAKMRLGPLYLTPIFQVRDVGVDTNVFDTATNAKTDFTATVAPRVDLWVPFGRRALLTTSTTAGLVYYYTYEKARSVEPDVLVRGDVYARRTTFYAEDRFFRTRERSFEVDATLARRSENAATAGVTFRMGSRITTDAAGFQRTVVYDEDVFFGTNLRDSLNRTENGARVTVRTKVTPLTTVLVRAELQRTRFTFSPVRDADGIRVSPGLEFSPKALISGSAEVGFRRFVGEDPALPPFTGLVARASLRYTLLEATQFGLTWDRDAIYSFELLWPYAVMNTIGGRVRRQIHGRVDGIASASRATYDFRAFNAVDAPPGRKDVAVSYSLDIGYRLNPQARIGIVATTWNRESSEPLRGYRDLRVGVSMSYLLPG